jgi:DnaJ-class molecular chaperone
MIYVSRPGYKKRMPGQGMPLMKEPEKYGDLVIEFDVEYPHNLNLDQKLYIKEALINNKKLHHHHQNKKKNMQYED